MATISGISLVKKLSLVFSRKAYLIYTGGSVPSLLVPLPTADKTLKKAIYKTFADLTNDEKLTFHSKQTASKDLNSSETELKPKLNVDVVNLPHQYVFDSVQGVEIKPNSVFLTVNGEDQSLAFMEYAEIQSHILKADTKPGQELHDGEKPKKEATAKQIQKSNKKVKGPSKQQKKVDQSEQKQEFKDEASFERKQMSTWNEQAPQLSTPPEQQPKQDISSMGTNKFIPLAYLSDSLRDKPIEIVHIQTSRQYLGLQFLKVFCMVNILCVYGLVHNWSRSENHGKGRD